MRFKMGELFSGPGGLALGAITAQSDDKKFSIEHAWATDYDKDTCETYKKNICPTSAKTVIRKDVRKLDYSRLEKISSIDALVFGFPCNDFSVVGEQKGIDGVYGPLYSYGIKALELFEPKWFLAENVGGLKNANEGNAFNTILKEMYDAGYNLYPHSYKFDEYGIPQARQRIIIVGIRKDIDVKFKVPSTTPYKNIDNTCRKAIEEPPIDANCPNHDFTKQSDIVVERLKHIKIGENAFTANLPKKLQLNVKGAKISQIYKRLDPSKPSYTITGSGGGGTHVYHWKEDRALTNRERARLQTFPDEFIFSGSKESVRKQIGMAVPVDGAHIIFKAILNSFAGIDYPSIECNIDTTEYPPIHLSAESNAMYSTNLYRNILINPAKQGADELCIVSGYATAAMAFHHLSELKKINNEIKVNLIVGMTASDGISANNDKAFKHLVETDFSHNFKCSYVTKNAPIDSKIYIWKKQGEFFQAFIGSANYTQNAFMGKNMRGVMANCDAVWAYDYYNSLIGDTIYCDHPDADGLINVFRDRRDNANRNKPLSTVKVDDNAVIDDFANLPSVNISLLGRDKQLPQRSGLNWGQRPELGREANQAYIRIPSAIARTDFFPPKTVHFSILTDDGYTIIGTRAQEEIGKAIHTPHNNSLIGEYFRGRLDLPNGAPITTEDLIKYGRTDLDFHKLDDETYYMNFFSSKKKQ